MILTYRECPHCKSDIDEATELYVADGEVVGCENCVTALYADFEDDSEELYADWCDSENDWRKHERMMEDAQI